MAEIIDLTKYIKKREERAKAERRRAREELKKIRALERRNRKNR